MRALCLAISLLLTTALYSQNSQTYFANDSLIEYHAAQENFDSLMIVLNAQFDYLQKNHLEDSLYKYTYKYGRTRSELAGTDAGMHAAEAFVRQIFEIDSSPSHQLTALSDLSWIYIEAGEDSLCFETDLKYLELCESYPEATVDERFMSHYALGFDYELMGISEKATFHFREALKPVLSDSIKYLDQVMDGYNGLGAAQWRKGDLRGAKESFTKSIHFSQYDKDTLNAYMYQANALGNISLVYEDEGNLIKSKESLEKSLAIRQKALKSIDELFQRDQQSRHLIRNYHNLSALYLTLGELERSKQAQDYCVKLRLEQFDKDHPDHAKSNEAYGSIAFARGDYQEALHFYSRSLKDMEIGFGSESPYVIMAHERLATTYRFMQRYDEALSESSKAIALRRKLGDPSLNQDLGKDYIERARIYQEMGDPERAMSDINRAELIFSETRSPEDPIFGTVFLQKGELLSISHPDSAMHFIDKSIGVGESAISDLGVKHSRIMAFLPQAYAQKASLMAASTGVNVQAIEVGKKGVDLLKQSRLSFQDDVSKLALFESEKSVFDVCIDLAFKLYFLSGDKEMLDQAFRLQEERKTILLRDQLNKFSSVRFSSVPDSLLIVEHQLTEILSGKNDEVTPDEVLKAEKDFANLKRTYKKSYSEYYALRFGDRVVSLDAVSEYARKYQLNLIEYAFTDQSAYAILISPDTIIAETIDLEALLPSLDRYNQMITSQADSLFDASHFLYRHLFQPFEKKVSGNQLVVVPDLGLFNLNFETLVRDFNGGRMNYMIYDYEISYALSASTTIQFESLDRQKGSRLLAVAPGFSDELKADYLAGMPDSVFIDQAYLSSIQQPFSVQTAQRVARSFGGKSLVDSFATESEFNSLAGQYQILHLGTHTEINNVSPLMSKFVLAKSHDSSQDGYLHAYEIYNMELRAELAVLTACETGIGKETTSEGALSIAHSFAYAGCPSIILSIWQIDEKSSSEIIEGFYKKLNSGASKSAALRAAKLEYLSNASVELSHPYFWSGLVLMGDTSPMVERSSNWILWLICSVIVIIVVRIVMKRRTAKR